MLHCALAPERIKESGLYYDRFKITSPSAAAEDAELATALWEESLRWVSAKLD